MIFEIQDLEIFIRDSKSREPLRDFESRESLINLEIIQQSRDKSRKTVLEIAIVSRDKFSIQVRNIPLSRDLL